MCEGQEGEVDIIGSELLPDLLELDQEAGDGGQDCPMADGDALGIPWVWMMEMRVKGVEDWRTGCGDTMRGHHTNEVI